VETLILAFDGELPTLEEVGAPLTRCAEVERQGDRLAVCDRDTCAFIRRQARPEARWFNHWHPDLVPGNPTTLLVAYRDVGLAKQIVAALGRRYRFVVDTDCDGVYTVRDFTRRCAREPDWDWLREAWLALPGRNGGSP
jgi:hypothetical protein